MTILFLILGEKAFKMHCINLMTKIQQLGNRNSVKILIQKKIKKKKKKPSNLNCLVYSLILYSLINVPQN